VAVGVVVVLEVVDVEEEEADLLAVALRAPDLRGQALLEVPLVEDAGEAVLVGRVLDGFELVHLHDGEPAEVGQHLDHGLRFRPPPPRPAYRDDAVQAVVGEDR